jgi:hypothetical protein
VQVAHHRRVAGCGRRVGAHPCSFVSRFAVDGR